MDNQEFNKRFALIISHIISLDTFDISVLKRLTNYDDNEIRETISFYKNSDHVVYQSTSIANRYYLLQKSTEKEIMFEAQDKVILWSSSRFGSKAKQNLFKFGFTTKFID